MIAMVKVVELTLCPGIKGGWNLARLSYSIPQGTYQSRDSNEQFRGSFPFHFRKILSSF